MDCSTSKPSFWSISSRDSKSYQTGIELQRPSLPDYETLCSQTTRMTMSEKKCNEPIVQEIPMSRSSYEANENRSKRDSTLSTTSKDKRRSTASSIRSALSINKRASYNPDTTESTSRPVSVISTHSNKRISFWSSSNPDYAVYANDPVEKTPVTQGRRMYVPRSAAKSFLATTSAKPTARAAGVTSAPRTG